MNGQLFFNRWWSRLKLLGLMIVSIVILIVPAQSQLTAWPQPDLLYCIVTIWMFRRPNVASAGFIVIPFLLSDFLLNRPPGLWTLLNISVIEIMKSQRKTILLFPFAVEWIYAGIGFAVILLLNRFILFITISDLVPIQSVFTHYLITMAAYPVLALIITYILRVPKPTMSETISRDEAE